MADIYAVYRELNKKHKLPSFSEMDNEFEISLVDTERFLLRGVIQRMTDKIEYHLALIDSILSPEASSISSIHECKYFNDEQKDELYILYKKLMDYNRRSVEISITRDEKEEAAFVRDFFAEWKKLKKEILHSVTIMRQSWNKETTTKQDLRYLG